MCGIWCLAVKTPDAVDVYRTHGVDANPDVLLGNNSGSAIGAKGCSPVVHDACIVVARTLVICAYFVEGVRKTLANVLVLHRDVGVPVLPLVFVLETSGVEELVLDRTGENAARPERQILRAAEEAADEGVAAVASDDADVVLLVGARHGSQTLHLAVELVHGVGDYGAVAGRYAAVELVGHDAAWPAHPLIGDGVVDIDGVLFVLNAGHITSPQADILHLKDTLRLLEIYKHDR